MSTLADAVSWVENDVLKRNDMTSALNAAAVNFYKVLTRKVPFDELMVTSNELLLTSGVSRYVIDTLADSTTAVMSPKLKAIMSCRLTYGPSGSNSVRLRRSAVRLYDSLSYTQPGQTSTYARIGKNIELNPAPNASNWTLRFRYWSIPTMDATPVNTTIVMDDDWLELIKWEVLYRAYYFLEQPEKAMALVMPSQMPPQRGVGRRRNMTEVGIIPRLWNDLLSTISAHEGSDEDFSINPVVRAYSVR